MTPLKKIDILRELETLGSRLRSEGKAFMSMEGVIDITATDVRLNRLGKCIGIGVSIIINFKDGKEMTKDEESTYQAYKQYLKECHDAFNIGRKP